MDFCYPMFFSDNMCGSTSCKKSQRVPGLACQTDLRFTDFALPICLILLACYHFQWSSGSWDSGDCCFLFGSSVDQNNTGFTTAMTYVAICGCTVLVHLALEPHPPNEHKWRFPQIRVPKLDGLEMKRTIKMDDLGVLFQETSKSSGLSCSGDIHCSNGHNSGAEVMAARAAPGGICACLGGALRYSQELFLGI